MRDNCYIDGASTWNRFGVWVIKGGYNDLLTFPALVDPEKNDWPEEDGIEVDLSAPKLVAKEITITFLASNPKIDVGEFIAYISTSGYHVLRVPVLQREWRLRLTTQTVNKVYRNAVEFALKFTEDVPVRPQEAIPDPGLYVPASSYELDDVPFSDYGIVVDVARDELLKSPTVKQNLLRKISTVDGQLYDADQVVYNSKETTFKCRLKAATIERFWSCYDAFFKALIQPEERQLYVDYISESYPCYYRKSSGFKVITLSGQVMVEFSLTLAFTVFRIGETEYILATEDGILIVLEDGVTEIDMRING